MDKLDLDGHDSSMTRLSSTQLETLAKAEWVTPTMEDVSEQVMAQPYIRFT